MLALYGIYRVHEKGMKSAGVYYDGRCFTVQLSIFPVQVRTAANVSQVFLGNEDSSMVLSLSLRNQKTAMIYRSLFFASKALPV
ncbi:hypothetical protein K443DRAFT_339388 [Laccaria amethystina LaAM-08-1]|uniref:Uncharacterized protein n=1 Tax=Laccaria amethystina LaAM-08-1 TaxID=1095629 RepID=A0A0C9XBF9_9AGAR|nr:hypothetical protein K443DRAFT_339388 [Laccaria amethystina LaAM-08-1]